MLLVAWIASVSGLAPAAADDVGPADDVVWVQVEHRQFPLSLEVPATTSLQRVDRLSLAAPRTDDRRRVEVDLFGLRPLRGNSAAVQIGFFWVTRDYAGVERDTLRALAGPAPDPAAIEAFLRAAFLRGLGVDLSDLGKDVTAGRPARRFAAARTVAPGTPHQRTLRGEIWVAPLDERATLVVVARFDPEATTREQQRWFLRVVRSVRLGTPEERDPMQLADLDLTACGRVIGFVHDCSRHASRRGALPGAARGRHRAGSRRE